MIFELVSAVLNRPGTVKAQRARNEWFDEYNAKMRRYIISRPEERLKLERKALHDNRQKATRGVRLYPVR